MHHVDQIIGGIACAIEAALLGCLIYRKLLGRYIVFFAYILGTLLGSIIETRLMANTIEYYVIVWIIRAVGSAVSLAVIISIFWPAVELVYRRLGVPGFILPVVLVAVIDFSFWRTLHHMFSRDWLGQAAGLIYAFDLAVGFVEVVIFVLALWLRRHYRKIWGRYSMDIIAGLAAISAATLVAYGTRLGLGNKFELFFRYLPSLASILVTLVWIITFSRPEPEDADSAGPTDPKQRDEVLGKAAEILDRTERILRRWPFQLLRVRN
jgi:hypothetical protein